jgi:hypothetical protein
MCIWLRKEVVGGGGGGGHGGAGTRAGGESEGEREKAVREFGL